MNVLKICAAVLVASLGLAASNVHAAPCNADKSLAANKVLAAKALDSWFNKRNASSVDDFLGDEYLQHNPVVPDGGEDLKAFIGQFGSDSKFELGSQAAADDLVWLHGRYTGIPGAPVTVIVDIFRFKEGKIVEHWDIAQPEVPAGETASGRPMFPIESSSAPVPVAKGCSDDAAPCETAEELAANKKLVATALDSWFNKRDASTVDTYTGGGYLQHNPAVSDGPEDLKAFIGQFGANSKFELGSQVAEGDLVWTHGRYTGIPGAPVMIIVDIFRVKDGKLVEHWDIAQPEVPATQTASGRPMFPIEA